MASIKHDPAVFEPTEIEGLIHPVISLKNNGTYLVFNSYGKRGISQSLQLLFTEEWIINIDLCTLF